MNHEEEKADVRSCSYFNQKFIKKM